MFRNIQDETIIYLNSTIFVCIGSRFYSVSFCGERPEPSFCVIVSTTDGDNCMLQRRPQPIREAGDTCRGFVSFDSLTVSMNVSTIATITAQPIASEHTGPWYHGYDRS